MSIPLIAGLFALVGCNGGDEPAEQQTAPAPVATATTPAPPTEAATAEATEEVEAGETYRVRSGDTLSGIAQEFDTTVRALVRLNDIDDPHDIRAGQRLKIPADN